MTSANELSTEHLRLTIRLRTIVGAIASGASQGGQLLLTVAYTAILARLISPYDFGLVAMATVCAGFLQVFKDAGLSTATIQREHITDAQVSNLFWINVAVGCAAMLAMFATSPLVAWFFRQKELVGISAILSIGFLLESLAVQHIAILNRQMRFTLLAGIELGSAATGLFVGVAMAVTHWGYWSLIGATLSTSACRVISVWTLSHWRPKSPSRQSGTRPLVRFGADLTLVGVVWAVSRGFDNLLIGRYLGSDAVGLYSRATALLTRPLERLMAPIYTVIVPALSRLQDDPERYRSAFLEVFGALAIAAYSLAGLLLPLSSLLVLVVLGEKWRAAAPIFAALTFAVVYLPLATGTSWLYTSQGRGRDLLITASSGAALMLAAFLVGLPFGARGVAIAYSVVSLVAILPLTFHIGGRAGPVGTRDLWFAASIHLPMFVTVSAATFVTRIWTARSLPPVAQLVACAAVGGVAWAVTVLIFPQTRRTVSGMVRRIREVRSMPVEYALRNTGA